MRNNIFIKGFMILRRLEGSRLRMSVLRVFLYLFFALPIYSQWSTDPANNLIVGYGLLPEMCSDSAGGAYVTYENNTVYPRKIELKRINRYGYLAWDSARLIIGDLPESRYASLTADGNNGVLIAYLDRERDSANHYLYKERLRVQRVDSNGNLLWGSHGVRVSLAEHNQSSAQSARVITDNQKGCILVWEDTLHVLMMQRIDSFGFRPWNNQGVLLDTGIFAYSCYPLLINAPNDRFIIGYAQSIYSLTSTLVKIDLDGNNLWGDGIILDFPLSRLACDVNGDVICSGRKLLRNTATLYAQRIDTSGIIKWSPTHIILSEDADLVDAVPICIFPDHSTLFAWTKTVFNNRRIFSQRISLLGTCMWGDSGILVSKINSNQFVPKLIPGNNDKIILSWYDSRTSVYTQMLDTSGIQIWDTNDVAISLVSINELSKDFITDKAGGFIACWANENFAICLQQVSQNGRLGELSTTIQSGGIDLPKSIVLYQNYPNPFNGSTRIQYEIPYLSWVKLDVFNILGEHIKTLVNQLQYTNTHNVLINAQDFTSGVYFYQLQVDENIYSRKFIIIK